MAAIFGDGFDCYAAVAVTFGNGTYSGWGQLMARRRR